MPLINHRVLSLKQRANSLPVEMKEWIDYACEGKLIEKNKSQLHALDTFMEQLIIRLSEDVERLMHLSRCKPTNIKEVLQQAEQVEGRIAKAHYIWDFFRSKLEQRFVPHFNRELLATDLIAHDCYTTFMNRAKKLQIQQELGFRDYPLTFFQGDYMSPVTLPRNVMLKRLDHRKLPVPVIGIPWDHISTPWEFLSLHHEVSHDIDTDLKQVSIELSDVIANDMQIEGASQNRITIWSRWLPEIFADFLGIILAGPPFVSFLAAYLAWPSKYVSILSADDEHPTPFLRTLLNVEFTKQLSLGKEAVDYVNELAAQWTSIYGKPSGVLSDFIGDFEAVINSILNSEITCLQDSGGCRHSLGEIVRFTEAEFDRQQFASKCLLNGKPIDKELPIRHLIGAAFLAIEQHGGKSSELINKLSKSFIDIILEKAPVGQLGIRPRRSVEHLKGLADMYYDNEHN